MKPVHLLTIPMFYTLPALLRRKRGLLALAAISMTLAGCGGGSSPLNGGSNLIGSAISTPSASIPTSNATGTAQTSHFGPLTTRGTSTQNPVTEGTSSAVTTGLAGSFSSMTLNYPTTALVASRIYFASSKDGSHYDIYSMSSDGTNVTLAVPISGTLFGFNVSHDGTKLVYSADNTVKGVSTRDIFITNTDGTGTLNLTKQTGSNIYPSISWDNKMVVFGSHRLNSISGKINTDIYQVKADGTTPPTLMTNDGTDGDGSPSFSPDGSKIVYSRPPGVGIIGSVIYVMDAATGKVQKQLTGTNTLLTEPAWSPDGSKIVCMDRPGGVSGKYILFLMNADGTNQGDLLYAETQDDGDHHPSFSLDGSEILYSHQSGTQTVIAEINPATIGDAVYLTNGPAIDVMPQWVTAPPQPLIGVRGLMGSRADGFFYSQQDSLQAIPCLVTFHSATGKSQTSTLSNVGTNLPFMAFQVQANSITTVNYLDNLTSLNGPTPLSTITLPDTSTTLPDTSTTALFTFNGATGQIAGLFSAQTSLSTTQFTIQNGVTAGVPLIIFSLQDPVITNVNYFNTTAQAGAQSAGINIPSSAGNLLLTYSSATGQLTNLLSYTLTKAVAPVAPMFANGACVLRGHFTAVYNAQGRNLASQGASEVHVDGATGMVTSIK